MDDYVSRAEALAKCHAVIATRDNGVGTIGLTYADLKELPAADVRENVRGEWVVMPHSNDWVKCSKCNCAMDYIMSSGCNYCPNCGADMRGGKDNA